uniref:Uncharacterized protein n=1 Tax=Homalodisca liturata TaxID=320908 RepID=A0A1B6I4R2_9HEMI
MAERQSSSTNAEVPNSEKAYSIVTTKANQLTDSKYHHKLRKPNFKIGEGESVKRTQGRFEKRVNEGDRNNELNNDSKGQPLHIKKALTLFSRRNTSHEVTWPPLVKKPIKMSKRRRRLLGGRPRSLRTSSSPKPNKAYKISLRQRKAKRKTKLTTDDCVDTNVYPTTHSLVNVHSRPVKHSTKQKRKHEMFEENASRIDFNKLLDSEEVKEDSVELSGNTKKDLLKSPLPAS